MSTAGYDLVVDPVSEINDLLVVTDVLVTDYSSSIFEYASLSAGPSSCSSATSTSTRRIRACTSTTGRR